MRKGITIMNKTKKFSIFLLCLLMICTLLGGCGNDEIEGVKEKGSNGSNQTQNNTNQQTSDPDADLYVKAFEYFSNYYDIKIKNADVSSEELKGKDFKTPQLSFKDARTFASFKMDLEKLYDVKDEELKITTKDGLKYSENTNTANAPVTKAEIEDMKLCSEKDLTELQTELSKKAAWNMYITVFFLILTLIVLVILFLNGKNSILDRIKKKTEDLSSEITGKIDNMSLRQGVGNQNNNQLLEKMSRLNDENIRLREEINRLRNNAPAPMPNVNLNVNYSSDEDAYNSQINLSAGIRDPRFRPCNVATNNMGTVVNFANSPNPYFYAIETNDGLKLYPAKFISVPTYGQFYSSFEIEGQGDNVSLIRPAVLMRNGGSDTYGIKEKGHVSLG